MINEDAIELIKKFEGCKLQAYLCPANVWTIGYGHTKGVKKGDKIDQSQADVMLKYDLEVFEKAVDKMLVVHLNENQRGALVSFAYNSGTTALRNSTLLQHVNVKDFPHAANEFLKWNHAGGKVLAGLTARRKAERKLFLIEYMTKV